MIYGPDTVLQGEIMMPRHFILIVALATPRIGNSKDKEKQEIIRNGFAQRIKAPIDTNKYSLIYNHTIHRKEKFLEKNASNTEYTHWNMTHIFQSLK